MTKVSLVFCALAALSSQVIAGTDLLVKVAPGVETLTVSGATFEKISPDWARVQSAQKILKASLLANGAILDVQPNYPIRLLEDYQLKDRLRRLILQKKIQKSGKVSFLAPADNPAIPEAVKNPESLDPMISRQWGMNDIGAPQAWKIELGSPKMIVAVLDTGVDYTHEDLVENLWRNTQEIPDNGIDDDQNGYIDDVIGWDFVSNDNKPYDLSMDPIDILFKGGNPGHGTHCAGNVAARGKNGKGISGVAPHVKIMSLRFISEKGQGTTADAIKAIRYAVDNGAQILSNSWGSEGEDPAAGEENKALREAVQYSQDKGTLFIAAAGNGHKGVGYDNDADPNPAYPASYSYENIISVAALNSQNNLGSFSNWGPQSVDLGAPGVVVFSTTVGNSYSDIVIDKYGFKATWDGTSMACPHVAGAAALYWSQNPSQSWMQVKEALLNSVEKIPSLEGKVLSNGKLNLKKLLD